MTQDTLALLQLLPPEQALIIQQMMATRGHILDDDGQRMRCRGIDLCFYPAGHLIGAVMVDIQIESLRLLVTGDFALRDIGGLDGAGWPMIAYDAIVMESSHGASIEYPTADPTQNTQALWGVCQSAIERGCTRLLIMAQALGEAQGIYESLCRAQMQGKLASMTVRLGGKAAKIAALYQQKASTPFSPWRLPLLTADIHEYFPANSIVIASGWETLPDEAVQALVNEYGPQLVIIRPSQGRQQADTYDFSLHASWGELFATALAVPCHEVLLYHGPSSTILAQRLIQTGRRVTSLTERLYALGDS